MAERIEFVSNYKDDSTENGFQFEFYCDRCGSGYATRFKPSAAGTISSVLDAASSLFGGVLRKAADLGDRARDATWEQAHDEAFMEAVEEIKPEFAQCPHCTEWVCRKMCWNAQRGLCKQCAPDLGVEMAVAQSDRSVEEIHRHASMADEDRKLSREHWKDRIVASCPECEAPLDRNAKFCPECGHKLQASRFCTECGAAMAATAKFCPECGTKSED